MSQNAYVVVEKWVSPQTQLQACFGIGVFLTYEDIPDRIRNSLGGPPPETGSMSSVQKDNGEQQVVIEVHNRKIGSIFYR